MKTRQRIELLLLSVAYTAIFIGATRVISLRDACLVIVSPMLITIVGIYYICRRRPTQA